MASPVQNILLTNTFDEWRIAFNELIISGPLNDENISVDSVNKRVGFFETSPDSSLHINVTEPEIHLENSTNNSDAYISYKDVNGNLILESDRNNEVPTSKISLKIANSDKVVVNRTGIDFKVDLSVNGTALEETLTIKTSQLDFDEDPLEIPVDLDVVGNLTNNGVPFESSEFNFDRNVTNSVSVNLNDKLSETLSPIDFGAVGDGTTDDRLSVYNTIISKTSRVIDGKGKTYKIGALINLLRTNLMDNLVIKNFVFDFSNLNNDDICLSFDAGDTPAYVSVTTNINANSQQFTVASSTGLVPSDSLLLFNDKTLSSNPDYSAKFGEIVTIKKVVGNVIYTDTPIALEFLTTDTIKITKINYINNLKIQNCVFKGSPTKRLTALYFYMIRNLEITNNKFIDFMTNNVNITRCENVLYENNEDVYTAELTSGVMESISIASPAKNIKINQNVSSGAKRFVSSGLSGYGTIKNLELTNNKVYGLISGITKLLSINDVTITDNTFSYSITSNSNNDGIYTNSLITVIKNNIFNINNSKAIFLQTFFRSLTTDVVSYVDISSNYINSKNSNSLNTIKLDIQKTGGLVTNYKISYVKISDNTVTGDILDITSIESSKSTIIDSVNISSNISSSVLNGNGISVDSISNSIINNLNINSNSIKCKNYTIGVTYPIYISNSLVNTFNVIINNNMITNGQVSFKITKVNGLTSNGNIITTTYIGYYYSVLQSSNIIFGNDLVNGVMYGNDDPVMIVSESFLQGTPSGVPILGDFTKRSLNRVIRNDIDNASLSDGVITLPKGNYEVDAVSQYYRTEATLTSIYNEDDNSLWINGERHLSINAYMENEDRSSDYSVIKTKLVLPTTTRISLRYRCSDNAGGTSGLGRVNNYTGINEEYAKVYIRKVK